MWEPQPPATLKASKACTGITLPYLYWEHVISFVSIVINVLFDYKTGDVTESCLNIEATYLFLAKIMQLAVVEYLRL
jgi:hypothetical protein